MPEIIPLESDYERTINVLEEAGLRFEGKEEDIYHDDTPPKSLHTGWFYIEADPDELQLGEEYPVAFMMDCGRKLLLVNGDIRGISRYHNKIKEALDLTAASNASPVRA